MALITSNERIAGGIYRMALTGVTPGRAGQFLELHPDDGSMLLPRPISIFDFDEASNTTRLVYRTVGRGTALFAGMKPGDALRVTGPLGNGFPAAGGNTVIIGGGLGVAPLYLLIKTLRASDPSRHISVYLGYSGEVFLEDEFAALADVLVCDVGGYITDKADFDADATFYACGPAMMLRAAAQKAMDRCKTLYVSLENRMACGVGACFGCSIETAHGMRRVCKDGPVFDASEVFYG